MNDVLKVTEACECPHNEIGMKHTGVLVSEGTVNVACARHNAVHL